MTAYQIEGVPMKGVEPRRTEFRSFCETLGALQPGESFIFHKKRFPANYHAALSALQYALNRRYTSRKEEKGYRIGRVS